MREVDKLIGRPGAWMYGGGRDEIVVSSRIRLARNVDGLPFPGWARESDALRLWKELVEPLRGLPSLDGPAVLSMDAVDDVDRQVLRERHLISNELAEKGRGSGVLFRSDETAGVMVNEEDHLRVQVLSPGMDLPGLWKRMEGLDAEIEERVRYAFSPRLGYLTACPTNLGTGLRASVMLHLPGLRMSGEIDAVVKGLGKLGLAVRGLMGEGTEAFGNMFQVSNQITLGETEEGIIQRLQQIVLEVIQHERNARARVLEQRPAHILDRVGRAFGILMHAHVLSSSEALDLLSSLRLGVETGMVRKLDAGQITQIMLLTQPGHLQKIEGKELDAEARDQVRARVVRERIRGVALAAGESEN